jgi:hypothetical protein
MALTDELNASANSERTDPANDAQGGNRPALVKLAKANSGRANSADQTGKTNSLPPHIANTANSQEKQQSCSRFVKNFYDWYWKIAEKEPQNNMSPIERAVHDKASCFSADLLAQLKEDLKVSAQNPGEIVGLDFDPILNAQDVATRYDIGKVTTKNERYRVDVYGTWNGKKNNKPDVTPELAFSNGKWTFVNFRYEREEPKTDLLTTLKLLREERKSSHK